MLFIFVLSNQIGRTPMKNLLINDLQPGMVTAETIYTDRGQMVMDAIDSRINFQAVLLQYS